MNFLLDDDKVNLDQVVKELRNQNWRDPPPEVISKLQSRCNRLTDALLASQVVTKEPSKFVPYLVAIDVCRFALPDNDLTRIANQLTTLMKNGINRSETRSSIDKLSYRFVGVLNPENRQLYNSVVCDPWEALREANILPADKLDVAKLIIPKDALFNAFILKFVSHLQLLLESDAFWVGNPWQGIFRLAQFKDAIKWENGTFYVSQTWIASEEQKGKILSAEKRLVFKSTVVPPVEKASPIFQPSENKNRGNPYYAFWANQGTLEAKDTNPPAMRLWTETFGQYVQIVKNNGGVTVVPIGISLKTSSIDLADLYQTLQFMQACHDNGYYTGPLFVYTTATDVIPTPPFSGSIDGSYTVSGPSKINLKPSAKSDLILLFTCLAEKEKELNQEKMAYWNKQVQEAKGVKSVADFIQEIEARA